MDAADKSADGTSWLRRGRIPSLDGMRAVAVLLVLFAHAYQTRGFPDVPILHAIARRGAIGVEVFFVISGFLITVLMLRELSGTGRLAIGRFYLRRVFRILPAYACLLLVVAVLQAMGQATLSGRDWTAATTYTVNFVHRPAWEIGHAWSLSIEEHFYLIWPFVIAISAARFGAGAALGCMVVCFLGRWVVLLAFPAYCPMAELWTFTRMDSIATGCLLAFLAWDDRWRSRLDGLCRKGVAPAAAVLFLIGSLFVSSFSAAITVGIAYTFNAICIAILVWSSLIQSDRWWTKALNQPALCAVGVGSYSIYLWQQLFLNGRNDGLLCSFPLNIFLSLAVAALSYHLVEKPCLALKQRVESLMVGRGATAALAPHDLCAVSAHGLASGGTATLGG